MFWGCHLKQGQSHKISENTEGTNVLYLSSASLAPNSDGKLP